METASNLKPENKWGSWSLQEEGQWCWEATSDIWDLNLDQSLLISHHGHIVVILVEVRSAKNVKQKQLTTRTW